MKSVGENVFAALETFEGRAERISQKNQLAENVPFAALNQGRAEAQS
jgi:hypothetical protein